MKYPIGIQGFDQIIEDGFVYVDKTKLVYDLVKEGKIYFLSRPRRFGKSLLLSTLACYFQGRKELFDGLAIADLEKDWLSYPVFRIDFNGGNFTQPGELEKTIETYLAQWENAFDCNKIRGYWSSTGTPTYLIRLLQHNDEQMNELTGKYYDPSMFVDYKADVERPLPMIYQSGYLTIKAYNRRMRIYLLDFPNNEVRKGFLSLLASNYLKPRKRDVAS